MNISNIKIKNFRNIISANLELQGLSILTGKNSSGKTNFLLALSQALNTDNDYYEVFANNTVTIGPGKDAAQIFTTISEIDQETCFLFQDQQSSKKHFTCIKPKQMIFEKEIGKDSISKSHKLRFTGDYFSSEDSKDNEVMQWEDFQGQKQKLYAQVKDKLVYQEFFHKEKPDGNTKIVNLLGKNSPERRDIYLSTVNSLNSVVSLLNPKVTIHDFITEECTRELCEQAADRLRGEKRGITAAFSKAKFIFILADLQRNKSAFRKFSEDLDFYTRGIVTKISMIEKGANRGVINIESPNGPSYIWSVSTGTSVLIYFIALLNWLRLARPDRSFRAPNLMIFDEVDSLIHPALMPFLKELLESISKHAQIILSTHSPYFLDGYSRKQIFLLKDEASVSAKNTNQNRCNIYSYQQIVEKHTEIIDLLNSKTNSEIFIEGLIDGLSPS